MNRRPINPEMLRAAGQGDPRALDLLLSTAQPDIRRFARATCRNAADVDDAAQETLWLLSRHAGAIRTPAAIMGWLWQVVRRQCLRLARRAGWSTDGPHDLAIHPDPALHIDLVRAFAALSAENRQIALLREVQGLPIAEIGQSLGLSIPTVKARLHRARAELRQHLQG